MSRNHFVIPAKAGIHLSKFVNWIPVCTGMTLAILLVFLLPTTYAASESDFYQVNQKVCDRFEADTVRLSAIMEEFRRREGVMETRVAYGNVDTPIERADYWITYAAEAIAFQRAKKYSNKNSLKNDLAILQGKIVRAKGEVKKALK